MWCDSDKITHQFVFNTWWKQDGVFAGNRKNHFEAESCQRKVSMALQLSSTCIALSVLFRLKSKIIVKGKHHSEPSIKKDCWRCMNMVTQPQSFKRVGVSTAVEKAWMNWSWIQMSRKYKIVYRSSTNFYLNISTASVMDEKVCQINQ